MRRANEEKGINDSDPLNSDLNSGRLKRRAPTRPLVPVACAFAAGILLDRAYPLSAGWLFGLWLAAAAATAGVLITRRIARTTAAALVYLAVMAAAMCVHHTRCRYEAPDDAAHLVRREPMMVCLRGQVTEEPWYSSFSGRREVYRISYDLAVEQVRTGDGWTDASGTVRVKQYGDLMEIPFGARMEVTGRLTTPRPVTVPGQFDYAAYLARNGVRSTLSVPGLHARVLGRGTVNPLRTVAHYVRWNARRIIEENFRRGEGALLEAVLLGNRRAVEEDVLEAFATSGTMHFLAISGLHVGIIAGLIWYLLRRLRVPPRWIRWIVIGCVVLYAYVTGGRPPIVRATVMTCAFCMATLIDREADIINILAASALVLLAANPATLFDAGFQLSFAAVFAIAGLMPLLMPYVTRMVRLLSEESKARTAVRYIALAFAASVTAWLGAAPLVAKHFHLVTPAVIVVSPLILPFVVFVLAGGIISVAVAAASPLLARPLVASTETLIVCFKKIVLATASFQLSYRHVPDALLAPLYYVALAAVILAGLRPRIRRAAIVVLLLWNLCPIFFWDIVPARQPDTVAALDVGKGTCVVATSGEGHTLVYDVGSTSIPHVGATRLAPYLWSRRIRRIDTLVVSHPETDHMNGVRELVWRFPVGRAVVSTHFGRFEQGRALLDFLEDRGIEVAVVEAPGIVPGLDAGEVLWPRADTGEVSVNDSSLVVRITRSGRRILLTGDIEKNAPAALLARPAALACDILQVPHHGRASPFAAELARATHPTVSLISDAEEKMSVESVETYEAAGGASYATWRSGTVTVYLSDMRVETHLKE